MKKIILFFTLLLSTTIFAQSFPGDKPELLIGKIVKPIEVEESMQKYFFNNFFLSFDFKKNEFITASKNKPFPVGKSIVDKSDYSKLLGKEFKVQKIHAYKESKYSDNSMYALELYNNDLGVIYYKYNPLYKNDYELEVLGELNFPDNYFCSKINQRKDKFNNEESFKTPSENGISFSKYINNDKVDIYMTVDVFGETLNIGKEGFYLLFQNGIKISKPNAEIDVKANKRGYIYSSFIKLTNEDIDIIKNNTLTDMRLYIYDSSVKIEDSKVLIKYLECLTK